MRSETATPLVNRSDAGGDATDSDSWSSSEEDGAPIVCDDETEVCKGTRRVQLPTVHGCTEPDDALSGELSGPHGCEDREDASTDLTRRGYSACRRPVHWISSMKIVGTTRRLFAKLAKRKVGAGWTEAWLLDSGANCVVVPPGDPNILWEQKAEIRELNTSGGKVKTWCGRVRTPIGVLDCIVSEGAPRLLPMYAVIEHGSFHWEYCDGPQVKFMGKKLDVIVRGMLPYLADSRTSASATLSEPDVNTEYIVQHAKTTDVLMPDTTRLAPERAAGGMACSSKQAKRRRKRQNLIHGATDSGVHDDTPAAEHEGRDAGPVGTVHGHVRGHSPSCCSQSPGILVPEWKDVGGSCRDESISDIAPCKIDFDASTTGIWSLDEKPGSSGGAVAAPAQRVGGPSLLPKDDPNEPRLGRLIRNTRGDLLKHGLLHAQGELNSDGEDVSEDDERPVESLRARRDARRANKITADLRRIVKTLGAKVQDQEHECTHRPARKSCRICQRAKKARSRFLRGKALRPKDISPHEILVVVDIKTDVGKSCWMPKCPRGYTYLLCGVIVNTGEFFAYPLSSRGDEEIRNAFHQMRVEFNIEAPQRVVFHVDNERGFVNSNSMDSYLRANKGRFIATIPHRKTAAALQERTVRTVAEGTATLLARAGLPVPFWPHASACWCYNYNRLRKPDVPHRVSCLPAMPFGLLGFCVLSNKVKSRKGVEPSAQPVCGLGPDRTTRYGWRVAFRDDEGKVSFTTVLSRDVRWTTRYAWARRVRNLRNVFRFCDDKALKPDGDYRDPDVAVPHDGGLTVAMPPPLVEDDVEYDQFHPRVQDIAAMLMESEIAEHEAEIRDNRVAAAEGRERAITAPLTDRFLPLHPSFIYLRLRGLRDLSDITEVDVEDWPGEDPFGELGKELFDAVPDSDDDQAEPPLFPGGVDPVLEVHPEDVAGPARAGVAPPDALVEHAGSERGSVGASDMGSNAPTAATAADLSLDKAYECEFAAFFTYSNRGRTLASTDAATREPVKVVRQREWGRGRIHWRDDGQPSRFAHAVRRAKRRNRAEIRQCRLRKRYGVERLHQVNVAQAYASRLASMKQSKSAAVRVQREVNETRRKLLAELDEMMLTDEEYSAYLRRWAGQPAEPAQGGRLVRATLEGVECGDEPGSTSYSARTEQYPKIPDTDCLPDADSERFRQFDNVLLRVACLTRLCSKGEKNSPEGVEARRQELKKVLEDYKCVDPCIRRDAARKRDANGTISGVHCITSIKGVEKQPQFRKWKGRLVLLGDQIRSLRDDRQVYPSGADFGLQGEVASLEGFRCVLAHALLNEKHVCQAADLTSAYLQAEWPARAPTHFLTFPQDVVDLLPKHLMPPNGDARGWVWPMRKCLYGHPVSGHVWIDTCTAFLKELGWIDVPGCPAVMRKDNCMLCVYVDDIAVSGPEGEVNQLWSALGDKFPIGAKNNCEEFLGASLRWFLEPGAAFRRVQIDMREYIDQIVKEFRERFPRWLEPCGAGREPACPRAKTPMASDPDKPLGEPKGGKGSVRAIRAADACVPIRESLREVSIPDAPPTKPEPRNQKLIGMILWIARVARPDVAFCVSRLGSRVASWNERCTKELARCVGYLERSREKLLELKVARSDAAAGFVDLSEPDMKALFDRVEDSDRPAGIYPSVHSDADWAAPKSQSGYLYGLYGSGGTNCPIAWGSKKQSITADSSGMSELIAAHLAVRVILPLHEGFFGNRDFGAHRPLCLQVDNSTVLRISRTGVSQLLAIAETKPMAVRLGLLRDLRELGVLRVVHVRTDVNRADALTKALETVKLEKGVELFGIVDLHRKLSERVAMAACVARAPQA